MSSSNPHILIVDDERAIREMISLALTREGFACLEAANAHEAEKLIQDEEPDLVLLDWMMPGVSGIDFIRRLRKGEQTRALPIIMLTAKTEEQDKIQGLDTGADDYLAKPFSTRELIARIRALLRRSTTSDESSIKSFSGLTLDEATHRVRADDHLIELGPTEFKLLNFFMQNPERVFSREQVLNNVWGEQVYVEDRTVDVHIRRLRKELEPTGHDKLIQTVRGAGYRFSKIV
ncbi:MAG: phosphate regulon transcriptional regulator PhoB [Acidiferrobacterales bacterium]|jgi:two-component system phosphate regulon response regulator PhoB|nr:phosphate regulon transcriptional regulator PhoB [Acidiferrobacterales bacterium]